MRQVDSKAGEFDWLLRILEGVLIDLNERRFEGVLSLNVSFSKGCVRSVDKDVKERIPLR